MVNNVKRDNMKMSVKKWFVCFYACMFSGLVKGQEAPVQNKLAWWQDAKFGMFLHWGLYSQAGGDWNGHPYDGNEHFMLYEKIPWQQYGQIGLQFNPVQFNAGEWVRMAKNAGMKYMVITAKHHDGFAMYDSKASSYNIVKMTPFAKDPMTLLAAACKKEGIKLCFYYSLGRDWQDPDVPTDWPVKAGRSNTWDFPDEDKKDLQLYIDRKVKPQLTELLTNYGDIGIIWFDTPELVTKKQSEELRQLIHTLQPNCIINSRIGHGLGDYAVSEQKIIDTVDHRPWESCVTMSKMWGYNKYDTSWKKPELTVRQLIEIVSKGGNLLLNVGPMGNGAFPAPAMERLSAIGRWMKTNNEAIYHTRPWRMAAEKIDGVLLPAKSSAEPAPKSHMDVLNDATPKDIFPEIRFTQKGETIYVFANSLNSKSITIKSLGQNGFKKIKTVSLLGYTKPLEWRQDGDALKITMPQKQKDAINVYVFKVG